MNRWFGFTLVELLLAIAISAVIALGTVKLFQVSVSTRDGLLAQSEAATQLSRTFRIIEQDFIQLQPNRPVRDAFGDYSPALSLDFDGLSLTRNGWAASRFIPYERSSLQRVRYRVAEVGSELCPWLEEDEDNDAGGCLIRSYPAHLDDDGQLAWQHQRLMRPVKSVNWQFLVDDSYLNQVEFQKEPSQIDPRTGESTGQVIAVQIELLLDSDQSFKRLFAVPVLPKLTPKGEVQS